MRKIFHTSFNKLFTNPIKSKSFIPFKKAIDKCFFSNHQQHYNYTNIIKQTNINKADRISMELSDNMDSVNNFLDESYLSSKYTPSSNNKIDINQSFLNKLDEEDVKKKKDNEEKNKKIYYKNEEFKDNNEYLKYLYNKECDSSIKFDSDPTIKELFQKIRDSFPYETHPLIYNANANVINMILEITKLNIKNSIAVDKTYENNYKIICMYVCSMKELNSLKVTLNNREQEMIFENYMQILNYISNVNKIILELSDNFKISDDLDDIMEKISNFKVSFIMNTSVMYYYYKYTPCSYQPIYLNLAAYHKELDLTKEENRVGFLKSKTDLSHLDSKLYNFNFNYRTNLNLKQLYSQLEENRTEEISPNILEIFHMTFYFTCDYLFFKTDSLSNYIDFDECNIIIIRNIDNKEKLKKFNSMLFNKLIYIFNLLSATSIIQSNDFLLAFKNQDFKGGINSFNINRCKLMLSILELLLNDILKYSFQTYESDSTYLREIHNSRTSFYYSNLTFFRVFNLKMIIDYCLYIESSSITLPMYSSKLLKCLDFSNYYNNLNLDDMNKYSITNDEYLEIYFNYNKSKLPYQQFSLESSSKRKIVYNKFNRNSFFELNSFLILAIRTNFMGVVVKGSITLRYMKIDAYHTLYKDFIEICHNKNKYMNMFYNENCKLITEHSINNHVTTIVSNFSEIPEYIISLQEIPKKAISYNCFKFLSSNKFLCLRRNKDKIDPIIDKIAKKVLEELKIGFDLKHFLLYNILHLISSFYYDNKEFWIEIFYKYYNLYPLNNDIHCGKKKFFTILNLDILNHEVYTQIRKDFLRKTYDLIKFEKKQEKIYLSKTIFLFSLFLFIPLILYYYFIFYYLYRIK